MNAKRTLLFVGLFGALQAAGFGQSTNSLLTATVSPTVKPLAPVESKQSKIEPSYSVPAYPLVELNLTTNSYRIERIGGESSRAWTTIVSQQPNLTAVHDASTHEPRFCLLSFGHKSQDW